MRNFLLYLFAIPIGLIASAILPVIFSKILGFFIPSETILSFLETFIISFFCGWIAVGITGLIVPSKKILFAAIMLLLGVTATIFTYHNGDKFNYMFIVGSVLGFFAVTSLPKN